MRTRTALAAGLALVVAACGGTSQASDSTTTTAAPTTTTAAPTAEITTADTPIGTVLVDADGMTLYGFTVDDPGTSNCNGDCAGTWPPIPGDTTVSSSVDASLVSTTTRDDGSTQLVIGDWPVYLFAGDSQPGDTNGQGINDVWFAIAPDGTLIGAPEPSASAGDSSSGITVATADVGQILVDADGFTLYGFTKDTPTTSACTDTCAGNWPPVPGDATLGDGVDASVFSTITRPDGSTQLAAGDWPLYRYAADSAPGDVNGQGVGGVWFTVAPDGTLHD